MNNKAIGKKTPISQAVGGALVSFGVCMCLCALVSCLIVNEILKVDWLEYAGMIIVLVSAMSGARRTVCKINGGNAWSLAIVGGLFISILGVIHMLVFRGSMINVVSVIIVVAVGIVISYYITPKKESNRKSVVRRRYR